MDHVGTEDVSRLVSSLPPRKQSQSRPRPKLGQDTWTWRAEANREKEVPGDSEAILLPVTADGLNGSVDQMEPHDYGQWPGAP